MIRCFIRGSNLLLIARKSHFNNCSGAAAPKALPFCCPRRIEAMRIFNGLRFSDGENHNNMADIIKKFDQHSLGQTQKFFEQFQ